MRKSFQVIRKLEPGKSFAVQSVIDQFSIDVDSYTEEFASEFDFPEKWGVGLIVGRSGTGKTTIAKELFPAEYAYSNNWCEETFSQRSIIEAMPGKVSEITKMFNSVGFSSPPSWLKPFSALSNGERMRVELAYCLLSNSPLTVFDEFTSVVDRQVAKIVSYCAQKAVRKTEKKFIAVTCHHDVEEWLLPDWTFNTDTMTFTDHASEAGLKKNRPGINLEIYRARDKKEAWGAFKKYHYLSHDHNNAATVYTLYADGALCGFCSVLNFPHAKIKKAVRVHRLVILPDFQGLGLGVLTQTEIAKMYVNDGYRFFLSSGHAAMKYGLSKYPNWIVTSQKRTFERESISKAQKSERSRDDNKSLAKSRFVTSWEYVK